MRELVELVDELRLFALALNTQVSSSHGISGETFPVAGLNMAYCQIVQGLELLYHYEGVFPENIKKDFENRVSEHLQEAQRVGSLFSSCFVTMMSSFEFCAKQTLPNIRQEYGEVKGRVYFGGIIKRSHELGWVAEDDKESWAALVELRNCIVHNNAVADIDFAFELSNGVKWSLVKGQPIVSTLRHFPRTIRWALEAYARWCDRAISVCKSGAQVKQA